MLIRLLILWFGGGLGTVCRFLLSGQVQQHFGLTFPYGTFAVNLLGCLVVGILGELFIKVSAPSDLRIFLMTGVLGGFTTFSAFGLDTVYLWKNGEPALAATYAISSVLLGICSVWVGMVLIRWVTTWLMSVH